MSQYLYEKIANQSNQKIVLDLQNIYKLIEVDADWLNQKLVEPNINLTIKEIDINHFNAYEQLVQQQVSQNLSPDNQTKINIVYEFADETNLSKDQVVNKIKTHPVTNQDFGYLQLWNDFHGIKIKTKFVKADEGGNYELRYKDSNKTDHLLDTKTIKTVVDLKPLANWLTTTLVQIEAGTSSNSIRRLIFSQIIAPNSPFNGKTWDLTNTVLNNLGIKIEYQKVDGQSGNPWGSQDLINGYDGQGRFNIRFVLEKDKANNIIAQISENEQLANPQSANQNSKPISVNLKVAKQIVIKDEFVQAFINSKDVIRGNTKNLEISVNDENSLIRKIKNDNQANNPNAQPSFESAPLIILYSIGQNPDRIPETNWLTRDVFTRTLAQNPNDQSSNQINFKFFIQTPTNQEPDFIVDPTISQLNRHEQPPNVSKIAYYINTNQWENYADNIFVNGTNGTLEWKWNNLNVTEEKDLSLITLNTGLKGLKIEFTTKNDARYDDTDGQAGANIKTNWSTTKPTSIDANTTSLFVRLKPQPGFVYQAQQEKTANVHNVDLQIKFQIQVNKNWIEIPELTSNDNYIDSLIVNDLETFSKQVLNNLQTGLRSKVELIFQFNEQGPWLNSSDLIEKINTYRTSYQSLTQNYGILQLFNGSSGLKIKAKFKIKSSLENEKYELVGNNNSADEADLSAVIKTGRIKTLIDLKTWINLIESIKIDFEPIINKPDSISKIKLPDFPGTLGSAPLAGLTFEQIEQVLQKHNISIEWRVVKFNQGADEDWGSKMQLTSYDPNNPKIQIRFKADSSKASNLVLSINGNQDFVGNQNTASSAITLILKVAAQIKIDPQLIEKFVNNPRRVAGDTKNLILDIQAEADLIKEIKNKNEASSPNLGFADAPLIIEYKLGDAGDAWLKSDSFIDSLLKNNQDQKTNKILFRFNLENQDSNDPDFSISTKSYTLSEHQEPNAEDLRIKYYINDGEWEQQASNVTVSGTSNNLHWNWNALGASIQERNDQVFAGQGLRIEFSAKENANYYDQAANDQIGADLKTEWIITKPSQISASLKNLWIRLKPLKGFIYGPENKNTASAKAISLDQLVTILSLNTQWLKQIKLNGNLKDLKIDESAVRKAMIASGKLPDDQNQLIKLEYSINEQNWFDKETFEKELLILDGRKNESNFILKREELKVRFNLNGNNGKYQLEIDGNLINAIDQISSQFNIDLINDRENRNVDVTGYINMNHLSSFNSNNFAINGSTSKPILVIKNRNELNNLLAVYASNNLFSLEFSNEFNKTNQKWKWLDQQVIWKDGQLVDEKELINQGIEIGPEGYFALRLRAIDPKYEVYDKTGKKQPHEDGYIIDISANVQITIEIQNPFSRAQKTLRIWTRENNNRPHYEQGQGGFKIVVANKDNLEVVNPNQPQSAQDFLDQSQDLIQSEKDALEFVYHIFPSEPTELQMQTVAGLINNYDDPTWNSFSKVADQENWTQGLGLKVGQFVAVALRVKEKQSHQSQTYILKDNDYSLVLPIINQANQIKMPGRLAGYEIKANKIEINSNILLFNNENSDLPLVDGFSSLQALNLKADPEAQYLGIELDLLLYNEFWLDDNKQILKTANGSKLIKRDLQGNVLKDQFYKNLDGSYITDFSGAKIPILKDEKGRPTAPITKEKPTLNKRLQIFSAGQFGLPTGLTQSEKEYLSFFRNQKIAVQFKPHLGIGGVSEPDFYLDQEKIVDLEKFISPQIKFPVENPSLITYEWDRENFLTDRIQYESTDPARPDVAAEGQTKIASLLKLIRKSANQEIEIITADTPLEVLKILDEKLKQDFYNQLRFELVYNSIDGGEQVYSDANIYRFKNLKNGDKLTLNIVPTSSDLVYLEQPNPLIINVRGLAVSAPNQEHLRFLRVEQNGKVNGKGSFRVLINDPARTDQATENLLSGWKFVIRVWDNQEQIKINWTADQSKIANLINGDKVEWKLVSSTGNPVKDAYYNTIAQQHTFLPNGSIQFNFAKVNYPNGQNTENVVASGIGQLPENEQIYPKDSGFVISGLEENNQLFTLDNDLFTKILAQLEPRYVGFNGQGSINFNEEYLKKNYYINQSGELYEKPLTLPTLKQQSNPNIAEISLADFLAQTTFYTSDPNLINYQNGFKFIGNDTNLNNHLSNGDQVWAQFDLKINNNEVNQGISTQLNPVSGLQELVTDPMTPLWYILMAIGGALTLGGLSLFMLWAKRNKKLKK